MISRMLFLFGLLFVLVIPYGNLAIAVTPTPTNIPSPTPVQATQPVQPTLNGSIWLLIQTL